MAAEQLIVGTGENFAGEIRHLMIADALLYLHAAFVAFVILGLVLVFAGKALQWDWIRNPWFRLLHLMAIAVVVLQAWFGVPCFLTIWENHFRQLAGDVVYEGSFIAHYVEALLYYQAEPWVFTTAYTSFGLLTVVSWVWIRPRGSSVQGENTL